MQALRRQLAEHLPLRQLPWPQSELELQLPSGALAHLPLRHDAPPQSELLLHELPAAVAHLPDRHATPAPQSDDELHEPLLPASASSGRPTLYAPQTRLVAIKTRHQVCLFMDCRLLADWVRARLVARPTTA